MINITLIKSMNASSTIVMKWFCLSAVASATDSGRVGCVQDGAVHRSEEADRHHLGDLFIREKRVVFCDRDNAPFLLYPVLAFSMFLLRRLCSPLLVNQLLTLYLTQST